MGKGDGFSANGYLVKTERRNSDDKTFVSRNPDDDLKSIGIYDLPAAYDESIERGSIIFSRDEKGEISGKASLLIVPPHNGTSSMPGAIQTGITPQQAVIGFIEAGSEKEFLSLIEEAEKEAARANKSELLMQIAPENGHQAAALFEAGFRVFAAESASSNRVHKDNPGALVFSKDLKQEERNIGSSKKFADMLETKWRQGDFDASSLGKLKRIDPGSSLTFTHRVEDEELWNSETRRQDPLTRKGFLELLARGRRITGFSHYKDKRGRSIATWSFSEENDGGTVLPAPEDASLESLLWSARLSDLALDATDTRDNFYQAAEIVKSLEEDYKNSINAYLKKRDNPEWQDEEKPSTKESLQTLEEIIANYEKKAKVSDKLIKEKLEALQQQLKSFAF